MRLSVFVAGGCVTVWCGLAALAAAPARPAKPAAKSAAVKAAPKPAAPAVNAPTGPAASHEAVQFFEKEVRPVLAEQCYSCHGPKVAQGGLRLDSRAALLKGGDRGPSLLPATPEKSPLLLAVQHHEGLKMPPGRKLPEKQIAALEKWVKMGAPWPGAQAAAPAAPQTWDAAMKIRKQWWSLQPVRKQVVPTVKNAAWSAQPVDRFILSKLEKKGLTPAKQADKRTLIRRVYLTLTGLPPAPQEVEQFVADTQPKAYERMVDRVLGSQHYGERWARHWMDVVRFGETHGYEWNYEVRDAWRYRDYLIRAFNQDVPYDQFVREHIAGDLIQNPRWNKAEGINESKIGTAFYRFGEAGHDVFKEIGLDVLDNQIDTLSKTFQATTVSCARCHDHKLDAVSTKDYHGLLGMLVSSRQVAHTLDAEDVNAARKARLKELKSKLRGYLAAQWTQDLEQTGKYLRAAQAAREKKPEAAELAKDLDPKRVQALATAIEKRKPAMEDPLFVWGTAVEGAAELSARWRDLGTRYATERKSRAEHNSKNFTLWGDFRNGKPEGWRVDGAGLRDGASPSGDFAVANEGDQALSGIFPAGLYTHSLSERMDGSVQSPWLPSNKHTVSIRVMGGKGGVARMIPDQRQLTDAGRNLPADAPTWITVQPSDRDDWNYLEVITKLHNPRYTGPEDDVRSFFGITQAVISDKGGAPKDDLARMERLFGAAEPQSLDEVAGRYTAALQQALKAWAEGKATDDDALWLDWALRTGLLNNTSKANPQVAELVSQYRAAEKELRAPTLVSGMADLDSFDVPIYIRGDFRNPGPVAPRRYLEVLGGSASAPTGSGRQQLADQITDPKNPLTARVMVNRIWHYLFGKGLVSTPDDFGHMGDKPSHPELLDYLAERFVREGWSVKKTVRMLMLTQTFQMASVPSARGREVEPENRLLHYFPARRLEAEAIRDSILAVSGRLDRTMYGPSIQPFRDDPKPERRLFGGPLDGNGRRSVYTKITLMGGPKFLEVFNFPDPKSTQGKRDVTNVPAQALTLMNDAFVVGQADFWADRLVKETDASVSARIDRMFRQALGRPANPQELARWEKAVNELATLNTVAPADVLKSRPVWKDVAHALFNLKEFIYVR